MSENKTDESQPKPTWRFIVLFSIGVAFFIGQIVLCVLFYNWAGLDWLLYLGWAILAVGLLLGTMACRALKKKGEATEKESWLATKVVVDSGVRYSAPDVSVFHMDQPGIDSHFPTLVKPGFRRPNNSASLP